MSNVTVPLLDLKAQYQTIQAELDEAVQRVIKTQYFIMGPEVSALEEEVADYSHCKHGIGVSSGTDALLVALMALNIGAGDEVITTPYTFFATAGSISRLGAKPVFVDIDPLTFNIDPTKIEAAITERTKAIMPVHLFGLMADMQPIMDIASQHNLYVIEDAAQAIGSEYNGKRAGSIGHLGCFSFFPSKNLGGFGDGGMVVTNDDALAERVNVLRKHGSQPKYYHKFVGGNFRLDALQAAVLRVKLQYLDEWSAARQRNAATYRQLFSDAGLTQPAEAVSCLLQGCQAGGREGACQLRQADSQKLVMPLEVDGYRHIYNQFSIRAPRRDELKAFLKENNIGCEIYYPLSLHQQECFADLQHNLGDFPASECAASQTLSLPVYPELTNEMMQAVVGKIAEFYQ